jgi:galactokinase
MHPARHLIDNAARGFAHSYGSTPDGVWSAPGRVNLIGEHTDYNEGFVLPFAINYRTVVAVGRRPDHLIRVTSTFCPGQVRIDLGEISPDTVTGWSAYPLGVAWALTRSHERRNLAGVDIFVDSRVPAGGGLSSSAALESAVACALNDLWDLEDDRPELAHAGQRAENTIVGAPTGIMDQFASLLGEIDSAVFLDCRTEQAQIVPLQFRNAGLELVVIDTKEHHSHATGGYAARRASCERAAHILDIPALRDIQVAGLPKIVGLLDDETFRRVRHVVTENERVVETVATLAARGPAAIGPQLTASHLSMRDDFEVSTPALDLAVDMALRSKALGARMTGGGFGGAAIALIRQEDTPELARSTRRAFAEAQLADPDVYTVTPCTGARRES